jgi:hypothetical protein
VTVDPILVRDVLADGAALLIGLLVVFVLWGACAYIYEVATRQREPGGR